MNIVKTIIVYFLAKYKFLMHQSFSTQQLHFLWTEAACQIVTGLNSFLSVQLRT